MRIKTFEAFVTEGLNPRDLSAIFGQGSDRQKANKIYKDFSSNNSKEIAKLKDKYPDWCYRTSNKYLDTLVELIKSKFDADMPKTLQAHLEDAILDDMQKEAFKRDMAERKLERKKK